MGEFTEFESPPQQDESLFPPAKDNYDPYQRAEDFVRETINHPALLTVLDDTADLWIAQSEEAYAQTDSQSRWTKTGREARATLKSAQEKIAALNTKIAAYDQNTKDIAKALEVILIREPYAAEYKTLYGESPKGITIDPKVKGVIGGRLKNAAIKLVGKAHQRSLSK